MYFDFYMRLDLLSSRENYSIQQLREFEHIEKKHLIKNEFFVANGVYL